MMVRAWLPGIFAVAVWSGMAAEPGWPSGTNSPAATRIEVPGIHNAFRLPGGVFSGSQPEGEAAFAALAGLGIKTLISVDGAKPDVAGAKQHGLRYIHLPVGYDGVPTNRVAGLLKAVQVSPGPVYVHCHHGYHRGPAAAAVICRATQGWTAEQAEAWMREAGTALDYPGLYLSVASLQKPSPREIEAVEDLPEIARTSSIVDAMVTIDELYARLKLCQQAGWKSPPGHPDVSPTHEATLLREQFREAVRSETAAGRVDDYLKKLARAEQLAADLGVALKGGDKALVEAGFQRIGESCSGCHRDYRNR